MKTTKSNTHPKTNPPKFVDMSHYTRWVNRLDEKDRGLSPEKRKGKWLFVLGVMVLFFVLSFILFPTVSLHYEKVSNPIQEVKIKSSKPRKSTVSTDLFEVPVDSFEQVLKDQIHERLPEKK